MLRAKNEIQSNPSSLTISLFKVPIRSLVCVVFTIHILDWLLSFAFLHTFIFPCHFSSVLCICLFMSFFLLGEAKVSCILRHLGVKLILAYSWARPAVLAAGKGRGGMFLFLLFLHFHSFSFLPCPSLSSPILSLLSIFSLTLGDDTEWPTRVDVSLNPNSINQSFFLSFNVALFVSLIQCRSDSVLLN